MNLLPKPSYVIVFFVLLAFFLVGVGLALFSDDPESGYWCMGIGLVPMALLLFMGSKDSRGR